jgi:hypothetical protein
MTLTTPEPIDPQARALLSTGAEGEALEDAWQAPIEKVYSPGFHRAMDEYVDAIMAQIAEADSK